MKLILSAIGLVAIVAASSAQSLSDSFSYPNGALVGAPGSPWTTNSGTTGQQNVVTGELFLDDNETEDAIAPLSSSATGGIISATLQLRIDPNDIPSSANGDFILHFVNSAGGFVGRLFTISSPGGATDDFLIGVSTTSATPTATFSNPFTAGTNLNATLSYDFSTQVASLAIAGAGSITATDTSAQTNINRFQFRQTTSTGDQFVDNLNVSVVPEPATWMLTGVGLLLGAQRLRRKV